jgi:WD40 repeat protein
MASEPPPIARALPDSPNDGVTSLAYLPNPAMSLLAAVGWDGALKIYDTKEASLQLSQAMESGPLLCLATPGDKAVVTGGLDGSIRRMELSSTTSELIGRHATESETSETSGACSCLASLPSLNVVASAGWNKKVSLWDLRTRESVAVSLLLNIVSLCWDNHSGK